MLASDMGLRVKGPLRAPRIFSMDNVNPAAQLTALSLDLIERLKSIRHKASFNFGFLIEFPCSVSTFKQPSPSQTAPMSLGNLSEVCTESPCVHFLQVANSQSQGDLQCGFSLGSGGVLTPL